MYMNYMCVKEVYYSKKKKNSFFAGYIEKLMSKTITFCEEDQECTVTEITPQPLCAAYEHPPKSRAIQEHKSQIVFRFYIS